MKLKSAIYAGLFGASGSLFGKFSGYSFEQIPFNWLLRIICLALMLLFNTLNLRYFINSLQVTNETLTATVVSAGFSYFFSFAFDIFIFKESLSFLSIVGIILILCGLYFICDNDNDSKSKTN